MTNPVQPFNQRRIERFFLLLVSLVLAFLFFNLHISLQREFDAVPGRLQQGTLVKLNAPYAAQNVKTLLQKGYYFEDERDITFIARALAQKFNADSILLDNTGALNKHSFYVEAERAYNEGGMAFQKRVALSRSLIGFTGEDSVRFQQELTAPPSLPASVNVGLGTSTIKGRILTANGDAAAKVLVRLQLVLPRDSLFTNTPNETVDEAADARSAIIKRYAQDAVGNRHLQALTAFARTDAEGKYQFQNLPQQQAYEVLPLQPAYQFGFSKGTADLDGTETFSFTRVPHTIRIFSGRDFSNLKTDKALIVRTPQAFNTWFWIIVIGFFLVFILVHLFFSWRLPAADGLLLPLIMLLTGLSFVTLFSLQQPLSDRFLAKSMFGYFVAGMAGFVFLQFFDLRRFTNASAFYKLFSKKETVYTASGLPWAGTGILLLLALVLFGSGPEGSGVKVNLFGFQPSELVKYITVLFLAGFFARNETFISEYKSWQKRWAFLRIALIAILATVFLFLVLGDLGPAIVCCFTFIVLFSFSRGDFSTMAAAVIAYVALVWGFENVWLATASIGGVLALYFFIIRKEVSESAVMAVVVMAAFLLMDQIPFLSYLFPGPVGRLIDRKAIWLDAWNNEVFGGDHVANSIWAIASGGFTGQGVGHGFAKTIPEAHTDMILPAMGEEFGLVVIVSVCLLFLLLLHRALLIGRQTGTPFLFYVSAGIGVSTFIQFLLIAGGSTGALPLSGVSLPFLSYGGASLICNLIAVGFLLSVSSVKGTPLQMKYLTRQQDKNVMPALLAAFAGIFLLIVNISRYALQNKKWIVEPALVADRSGARMFSYNPRISILMDRLEAGSLYDRMHRLLGTSNASKIRQQQDSLVEAGLEASTLQLLQHRRQSRYYPFGAQTFFWTGDANTGIFNGGSNGYFAEYRHNAALRGFNTPLQTLNATANRYRDHRFLPQRVREMTLAKIDYSVLAPLLLAGVESRAVNEFKKQNRDMQLSIDAALQTGLQKSLAADTSVAGKRVSIVILADSTGDVLASALYPLPPVADWDLLNTAAAATEGTLNNITSTDLGFTYATQPGSTAKLATALAAFNKLGLSAAQKTFLVRPEDRIRVRSDEPDETGQISMARAIVNSNNVYFIRLANEAALEEEMATIYQQTGLFLHGVGGYFYNKDTSNIFQQERWRQLWRTTEFTSRNRYNKNDIRATRGLGISGMAWGQGELVATPASVARLAAAISNKGVLVPHRFVLKIADSALAVRNGLPVATNPQYADLLTGYMKAQSAPKQATLGLAVAGKTGTPERIANGKRINDGWYVFFAPAQKTAGNIVVCIRIENCKGSSEAVKLAGRTVLPALQSMGYLKSSEPGLKNP